MVILYLIILYFCNLYVKLFQLKIKNKDLGKEIDKDKSIYVCIVQCKKKNLCKKRYFYNNR